MRGAFGLAVCVTCVRTSKFPTPPRQPSPAPSLSSFSTLQVMVAAVILGVPALGMFWDFYSDPSRCARLYGDFFSLPTLIAVFDLSWFTVRLSRWGGEERGGEGCGSPPWARVPSKSSLFGSLPLSPPHLDPPPPRADPTPTPL